MSEQDLKTAVNETEGKKPLLYEMDQVKRVNLASLVLQPGWQVLIEMMEFACKEATGRVIKLDVEVDGYSKKLAALQQMAQCTNRFCARVLSSVDYHVNLAVYQQSQEDEAAEKAALLAEITESHQ